ncbi:hypothetical protein [Hoyosella altamirensis]|uniref:DUF732 domain-containing protein n=2 Tax=Hoyosella altamirensis TaxID=616997 RepID=A0A839RMF7_9ACTN|nr:hypothetical protein [Hoyosella altamirensis]MBB3037334.1 hypothetical protein [Hoyosella altamirensis]
MRAFKSLASLAVLPLLLAACGSSEPETREELADRLEQISGEPITPEEADELAGWVCGAFAMAAEFDVPEPTAAEFAAEEEISESQAQEIMDVLMQWRCPDGPEGEPANMPSPTTADAAGDPEYAEIQPADDVNVTLNDPFEMGGSNHRGLGSATITITDVDTAPLCEYYGPPTYEEVREPGPYIAVEFDVRVVETSVPVSFGHPGWFRAQDPDGYVTDDITISSTCDDFPGFTSSELRPGDRHKGWVLLQDHKIQPGDNLLIQWPGNRDGHPFSFEIPAGDRESTPTTAGSEIHEPSGRERIYSPEGLSDDEIDEGCAEGYVHPQICHSRGY